MDKDFDQMPEPKWFTDRAILQAAEMLAEIFEGQQRARAIANRAANIRTLRKMMGPG